MRAGSPWRFLAETGILQDLGERPLRPCPHVTDDLGRCVRSQPATVPEIEAPRQTDQKACREQVSGTGRVHHPFDRYRIDDVQLLTTDYDAAGRAPREGREAAIASGQLAGFVEVVHLVERLDFHLVGEQDDRKSV